MRRRVLSALVSASAAWLSVGCVSGTDGLTAVFYTVERGPTLQGELHTLWIEPLDPRTLEPIEPADQTLLRIDLTTTPLPVTGLIRPGRQYRSEVIIAATAVRFGETVAVARERASFASGEITLARLTLMPPAADADTEADADADADAACEAEAREGAGSDCDAACEADDVTAEPEEQAEADRESEECQPRTCAQQGLACGAHTDGCGAPLDCGICDLERFCSVEGRCECHFAQCQGQCCAEAQICDAIDGSCCLPNTCDSLQIECGATPDGCGHDLDCGGCADHAECAAGRCECATGWCNFECCGADQRCFLGACCTPQCEGRCDGSNDGCGSTCDGCPDGEECSAGACVACGGAKQPCCADSSCNTLGHACASASQQCKPIAFLRLSPAEPATSDCGDADYQAAGYWTTEPGLADGADEATDSIKDSRLDAGWVLLCGLDGRVSAQIGGDDCSGREASCPAGTTRRGSWHVGTADCSGTKHAVDAASTLLLSGWLDLCVADGMQAKVELGTSTCGTTGPRCGGWLKAGAWHLGYGCGDGDRIKGASGQTSEDGWVDLCLLAGD